MSLKMSKTRIDKSYVNISLPHDNSTGSNKPHTKCQLTPWPGFVARLTWSCLRQIFEITEMIRTFINPGLVAQMITFTLVYHSWIEFSSFTFYEQIYEKRAN